MGPLQVKSARTGWTNSSKRKVDGEEPTYIDDRQTKRRQTIPDSLIDGFSKLLTQRSLDDLPQEILLNIFQHFAEPWVLSDDLADWEVYALDQESRIRQQTLIALTKTCRSLNQPATSILYRCAHLPTDKSLLCFLRSLYIQPSLTELVKQVSCSQNVQVFVFHNVPLSDSDPLIKAELLRLGKTTLYDISSVRVYALYRVLKRIPAIRALSISCCIPWNNAFPVSVLPSEHLSKLSIATNQLLYLKLRHLSAAGDPLLTWLNKSNLGRYPALKQLELVHPQGKWMANLVTVEATHKSGPAVPKKYVTSLTTRWRDGGGTAAWDLLSLGQDIFSPEHLHTLDYTGQSRRCSGFCYVNVLGWDLNRFLATAGRRVRTLILDWEHDHPQLAQLGPTGTLTSLPMLTSLTHLTVSMQVLFRQHTIFHNHLTYILEDPAAELARLLPASLRVLRISEFMPNILRSQNQDAQDRSVLGYNSCVYSFMEVLRVYWLDARGDRELWFRHYLELERHPRLADEESRRELRWLVSCQRHQDVGIEFARVYPMLPHNAAIIRDSMEAQSSG